MKNIIEELYYGRILSFSESFVRTPNHKKILEELLETEKIILNKFPEVEELLEKFSETQAALSESTSYNQFFNGFRIGMQIAVIALTPSESDE